jgi:hypothetical protein
LIQKRKNEDNCHVSGEKSCLGSCEKEANGLDFSQLVASAAGRPRARCFFYTTAAASIAEPLLTLAPLIKAVREIARNK